MKVEYLITLLSWEDRYFLGLRSNIIEYNPSAVILFIYNNPSTMEWKRENLEKTRDLVGDRLKIIYLNAIEPDKNWFIFKEFFAQVELYSSVLVDISTMTRETIWLSLYYCKLRNCDTRYIYFKPAPGGYSPEWISRDPGKPRLLYKMSGIAKLGAPTLLLITGGFDIQRLDSLVYNFEPKYTMLFFQDDKDFRNEENLRQCKDLFRNKYSIESLFQYNPYDVESSYEIILEKLNEKENGGFESYLDSCNIIFSSLGAKTSAITLFNIWLKYPHVALSYIPSKEYNKDYSKGIGESIWGKIPF